MTVTEYLASLPADRKKALTALRKTIRANLAKGFKESFNWGMISYEIPLTTYPDTYNKQPLMLAALASQKGHIGVYLMCANMDPETERLLRDGYKKHGLKLDMGKACIRAKKLEDIPLDVLGKVIKSQSPKKLIALYEKSRRS